MEREENLTIEFTREDVENLAKIFIQYFSTNNTNIITYYKKIGNEQTIKVYVIENIEDIKDFLNLEEIVTPVHGLTDPIGQLMKWLADQFNWLVSQIETIFTNIISSFTTSIYNFITSMTTTITNYISSAIEGITNAISSFVSTITSTISNFMNTISSLISQIGSIIQTSISTLTNVISTLSSTITNFLNTLPSLLSSMISNLLSTIQNSLSSFYTSIQSLFTRIVNNFNAIAQNIISYISVLQQYISQFTTTIINTITKNFQMLSSLISSFISSTTSFIQTIITYVSQIPNYISVGFQTISRYLMKIPESITEMFQYLSNILQTYIIIPMQRGFETISKMLNQVGVAIMGFVNAILKYPEWFPKWFYENIAKPIYDALQGLASWIWENMPDWLKTAIENISKFFTQAWNSLVWFFTEALPKFFTQDLPQFIMSIPKYLQDFAKWIWENLPDWLRIGFEAISNFFKQAWDSLVWFFTKAIPEFFTKTLPEFIMSIPQRLKEFASWIWEHLPDWLKNFIIAIQNFFNQVWKSLVWFFTEALPKFFTQDIPKFFTETIPNAFRQFVDWLKSGFEFVWRKIIEFYGLASNFINSIVNLFTEFSKDPITFIREKILQPVWNVLQWFIQQLLTFPTNLINIIVNGVKNFINNTLNIIKASISTLLDVGKSITLDALSIVVNVSKEFGEAISSIFKEIFMNIACDLRKAFTNLKDYILAGRGGEFQAFFLPFILAIPTLTVPIVVRKGLQAIGTFLTEFTLNLGIPNTFWRIVFNIGGFLRTLASSIADLPQKVLEGFIWGYSLNAFETLRYVYRGTFKWLFSAIGLGDLPIEMPWMEYVIETLRRYRIEDNLQYIWHLFWMRGYPNWFMDLFIKSEDEAYFHVVDRFGNPRKIPLSPLYVYPSISDLARFMVRDMFGTLEGRETKVTKITQEVTTPEGKITIERYGTKVTPLRYETPFDVFKEWCKRIGVHENVAFFYYLLHFRYPSPEKLWDFVSRGIAGLLWYRPPEEIKRIVEQEIKQMKLENWTYNPPYKLNHQYGLLLEAFSRYMKWHDYALFPWVNEFAPDNWIVIDTLADIPGKIDQRWMVKWGLYEKLMGRKSAKELTETPFLELLPDVLEDAPKSKVQLHLFLFCKTLQATGLHPDWVPITAVAEAMNMLTEERTLLRTGFMNLFKEGYWDVKALEKLLQGFVLASFEVGRFDIENKRWEVKWINLPVMFLPAERKLLELRALMDRALDILRDFGKEITIAFADNIVISEDEYYKAIDDIVNAVNKWFAKDFEEITGYKLPEELKIRRVKEYWETYVEVAKKWKEVYTTRRIRYWFARLIAWTLYRLAYGYIKKEDLSKIISVIKEKAKLTDTEAEAILTIGEYMVTYAKREYIPTPSQLATIVEVVPKAIQKMESVFTARGVPEEWQDIWKDYIRIRPLTDELRMLRTALITAFARGDITENEFREGLNFLKRYGWTDEELKVIEEIAKVRAKYYERRQVVREYIPTPTMLITMLEYVPEAWEKFMDVMKKRGVPEDWINIWKLYAERRPLWNDFRTYLSRFQYLFSYGLFNLPHAKELENTLKQYGFTNGEIHFWQETIKLYRAQRIWLHLIPSPIALTGYYRYTDLARDLLNLKLNKLIEREVLNGLPLGMELRQFINLLFNFYNEMARNRAVYPDLRGYIYELVRGYEYGVVDDATLDRELRWLKRFGLKDENIELIKRRAKIRRAIRIARGY